MLQESDCSALLAVLQKVLAGAGNPPLYLAGGAIREWLAAGKSLPQEAAAGPPAAAYRIKDLDFTLPAGAVALARNLARELDATFVPLDPEHDVARVVWRDWDLDFAAFREQSGTIEEDLGRRDFTINAMALRLNPPGADLWLPPAGQEPGLNQGRLLDPWGGGEDLRAGLIRAVNPRVFMADPLRLLRAFRFQAVLGMRLEPATEALLRQDLPAIRTVAAERVRYEMDAILAAPGGAGAVAAMAAAGLLYQVLPEMAAGAGLEQPSSHHLDVSGHGIEALAQLAEVLVNPARFFPHFHRELAAYLHDPAHPGRGQALRWATLLHDLGKPAVHRRQDQRISFYNHDRIGAELCRGIALRLRFSRERTRLLQLLVAHHMWPFHLSNSRLKTGISPRACLRLIRAVGDDLPALFLLAMADSLAGRGSGKPPAMEQNLADLYTEIMTVARERITPVLQQPPLLNGHDLQKICGLTPGPLFKRILAELEQVRVEGIVTNREQALAWVRQFRP